MVFEKTDILLPKIKDYRKWAVVACDQFTSQPEYWENVQKYVGDEVSTYNLILPEAQLSENNDDKIASINETMNSYLKRNIFETYNDSYIYVERKLKNGAIRKGIVGAIDLEDYDYKPNAKSKIRATEKTVVDRIPPRVKIRENANIELPHILLLCDTHIVFIFVRKSLISTFISNLCIGSNCCDSSCKFSSSTNAYLAFILVPKAFFCCS